MEGRLLMHFFNQKKGNYMPPEKLSSLGYQKETTQGLAINVSTQILRQLLDVAIHKWERVDQCQLSRC